MMNLMEIKNRKEKLMTTTGEVFLKYKEGLENLTHSCYIEGKRIKGKQIMRLKIYANRGMSNRKWFIMKDLQCLIYYPKTLGQGLRKICSDISKSRIAECLNYQKSGKKIQKSHFLKEI